MNITDFFSKDSILTFTGASGTVWIICNTLRTLFILTQAKTILWLVFSVSLFVSFFIGYISKVSFSLENSVLTILNGFLLFSTTTGFQEFSSFLTTKQEVLVTNRFLRSWVKHT